MADPADSIIHVIYDAIAEDEAYAEVTRRLAQHLGGATAWIQEIRPEGVRIGSAHNFNPDIVAPYQAHFYDKDVWLNVADRVPPNTAVALQRYVSPMEYENSEIYNDLVKRNGDIFHSLGAIIAEGPYAMGVGIQRERAQLEFDEQAERALQALTPHLQRMMTARRRLEPRRARQSAFERWFEDDPDALLLVTSRMAIVHRNAEAARLLARDDALCVRWGATLSSGSAAVQARLVSGVKDATRGAGAVTSLFSIEKADGLDLELMIEPWTAAGVERLALVRIRDRARLIQRQASRGAEVFGFTQAETAVAAAILQGLAVDSIAQIRGVGTETVRNQIRALLAKTGASRQAELVARLAMLLTTRST